MMSDVARFIQVRHIDSFQKLQLLIFLYQHPESNWTSQQMAEGLYLGDVPWLEEMIADLQAAGLIDCTANRCQLSDDACVNSCLQRLAKLCEDPLARQEILESVRHRASAASHYQERAHEAR
jgi:hypothetical protein